MGRHRASDPCVSTSLSLPLSATARLERLAQRLGSRDGSRLLARDLLLQAIAEQEARLGLPPFVVSAAEAQAAPAPYLPGSAADPNFRPVPSPAHVAPPAPLAVPAPSAGPELPPFAAIDGFWNRAPDESPTAALERCMPPLPGTRTQGGV